MALYMYQASYSARSMAAQLKEPQDPVEAIRPTLEDLGAKMVVAGFPFGEYDVLVVYEAPDDMTAASVAMAVAAEGEVKSAKTTRLLSGQEWLESLRKRRTVNTGKARQPHDPQRQLPELLSGARWQRFCDHEPMPSRRVEWAVAGALAGWAAARLAGADRLRVAEAWTVPLVSFTPQVTAGAWAGALLLHGAGPAAATAVAGAALTAVVGPRAVPYRQPPAAGPVLRVVTANLLFGRAALQHQSYISGRGNPLMTTLSNFRGQHLRHRRSRHVKDHRVVLK